MCIILPVSHIPCTHTTSIWQHCVNAERSKKSGVTPCQNVRHHERPILTRKPCEDCSIQRCFARRGVTAQRGNDSPPQKPEAVAKAEDDDADDSGYHSDVIHEGYEGSDLDDYPLSPEAMALPRARSKTCKQRKRNLLRYRSSTRKPSWRLNLKRDLSKLNFEDTALSLPRHNSIDSLLSKRDDKSWHAARVEVAPQGMKTSTSRIQGSLIRGNWNIRLRKERTSTLLHPSSPPPIEITGQAQVAKAFPFPQMVEVRRSSSGHSATRPRNNSTLLHPSSPMLGPMTERPTIDNLQVPRTEYSTMLKRRPAVVIRRESSLLHPSYPPETASPSPAQIPTIISVPPARPKALARRPSTLLHPSWPRTSPQHPPILLRRMPPLQTTVSEPQSATRPRQRRASILHSCLSDEEDGSEDEGSGKENQTKFEDVRRALQAFSFNSVPNQGGHHTKQNDAETTILANTAFAARQNRNGLPGEWRN